MTRASTGERHRTFSHLFVLQRADHDRCVAVAEQMAQREGLIRVLDMKPMLDGGLEPGHQFLECAVHISFGGNRILTAGGDELSVTPK